MLKFFFLILIACILFSLASGLYYLLTDRSKGKRGSHENPWRKVRWGGGSGLVISESVWLVSTRGSIVLIVDTYSSSFSFYYYDTLQFYRYIVVIFTKSFQLQQPLHAMQYPITNHCRSACSCINQSYQQI